MKLLAVLVCLSALLVSAQDEPPGLLPGGDPKMAGVEILARMPYPKGFGGPLKREAVLDRPPESPPSPGAVRLGRPGLTGRYELQAGGPNLYGLSPDGRHVAGFLRGGTVRVWKADMLEPVADFASPVWEAEGSGRPRFAPDGKSLWTAWQRRTFYGTGVPVLEHDLATGQARDRGRTGINNGDADFLSADGRVVLAVGPKRWTRSAVPRAGGPALGEFVQPNNWGFAFNELNRLSPDGSRLMRTYGSDLLITNAGGKAPIEVASASRGGVHDARFVTRDRLLLARSDGLETMLFADGVGKSSLRPVAGERHGLSEDGETLVSFVWVRNERRVVVRATSDLKELASFPVHPNDADPTGLQVDGGRTVVLASSHRGATLYRVKTGEAVRPPDRVGGLALAVLPSDGGRWLAVYDNGLRLWSAEGRPLGEWHLPGEEVQAVVPTRDGRAIVFSAPFDQRRDFAKWPPRFRDQLARLIDPSAASEAGLLRLSGNESPYHFRTDFSRPAGAKLIYHDDPTRHIDFGPPAGYKDAGRWDHLEEFGPWPVAGHPALKPRTIAEQRDPEATLRISRDPDMKADWDRPLRRLVLTEEGRKGAVASTELRISFGELFLDPARGLAHSVPMPFTCSRSLPRTAFDLADLKEVPGHGVWPEGLAGAILLPGGRLFAAIGEGCVVVVEARTGLVRVRHPVAGVRPVKLFPGSDDRNFAGSLGDGSTAVWPTSPHQADPKPAGAAALDNWYEQLRSDDGREVGDAIGGLVRHPEAAVKLLAKALPRRETVEEPQEVRRAVEALRSAPTGGLDAARAKVVAFGQSALPEIAAALRGSPADTARRLADADALIRRAARGAGDGRALQLVRAVEVLDRIGTPAARELLGVLAGRGGTAVLQFEAGLPR